MKIKLTALILLILGPFILPAQTFEIDKVHTFVQFAVKRFAAVDVHGRFNDYSGTITYDPASKMITSASFTINVESIDTGHDVRDGHLKGDIWLGAAAHPTITFKADSFNKDGEGYIATGELTIKGVANTVELPFAMTGPAVDPTKQTTNGISTAITINRQDYGITFSKLMDNGKLFIGNDVAITINALAQAK